MIVTISGASGVGKTTIVKELLKQLSDSRMIVSYTTRQARSSDLPGEYAYISGAELQKLRESHSLIWYISLHGINYGTAFMDIDQTQKWPNAIFFMVLTPQVIEKLRSYTYGKKIKVVSFYILSPPENIMRKRLLGRGENEETINRRIADCRGWDTAAKSSGCFEFFITNDGDIKDTVSVISSAIRIS